MKARSPTASSAFGGGGSLRFFLDFAAPAPMRTSTRAASSAPGTQWRVGPVRRIDLPPCAALGEDPRARPEDRAAPCRADPSDPPRPCETADRMTGATHGG